MEERTTGLILRTRLLTESSLIVQWLTTEFGRLSTVAKGARRPKSSFLGKLDLFYLADLSFVPSRRSDLHTLREVSVRERFEALRLDLPRLQQASYFVQLLEQTTEANTPLPGFFDLLQSALRTLVAEPARPFRVCAFELKLLLLLGLEPAYEQTQLSPRLRSILRQAADSDWAAVDEFALSAGEVEEIERFLHGYLIYHLGRIPKTRGAALLHVR